jgi:hypothetical protein
MPSARRPNSYRQYYCDKQGEFAANLCFEVFLSVLMPPEVVMPMSFSLCEPESRADGALAAQEVNQLINAVSRRPLPMQWQPRDSPISSNSTDYLARTTSAPAFQILETMPATAPRERPRASGSGSYRRGRGRGMRRPCSDQSCSAYFEDYPPPICYSTTCSASTAKEIRPLANRSNFVSGHFLAEKTYLVGY